MTNEQIAALKAVAKAITEAVAIAGPLGAPGFSAGTDPCVGRLGDGYLYAALMSAGCTLNQFEQIMSGLVRAGVLTKRGECYFVKGAK